MLIKCEPCKSKHRVNATEMVIVIEQLMEGYGHTVSFGRSKGRKIVQINPVCLAQLIPTVARRDAA